MKRNGLLYDPDVGRFLSADPYIQNPGFTQNYKRYSYCLNNSLKYTDPSGNQMTAYQYFMQNVLGESGGRGFDGYKNGDGLGGGGAGGNEGFGPGGWNGTGLGGYYYDWYTQTYRSTSSGNQAVSWNQVYYTVGQFWDAYSTSSTLDMGMHEQVYSNAYRPNPNGTIHLYVSYLDFVAVGTFTGGERNWLDKTQILMESYGLVNSSKEELFELAAKSSPSIND